jgi:hypothetical protein
VSRCYFCGGQATGKQHVPPQSFFPRDSRNLNLITVPSCHEHNHGMKDLEAEFRAFLVSAHGGSASAEKVLRKGVLSDTARRHPHVRKLRQGFRTIELKHNDAIIEIPALTCSKEVGDDFLTALTRGLIAHLYPEYWSPALYFAVHHLNAAIAKTDPKKRIEAARGLLPDLNRLNKGDVFTCYHGRARDIPYFSSVWIFVFFESAEFMVFCSTKWQIELCD